jgi:hypothetical protein
MIAEQALHFVVRFFIGQLEIEYRVTRVALAIQRHELCDSRGLLDDVADHPVDRTFRQGTSPSTRSA